MTDAYFAFPVDSVTAPALRAAIIERVRLLSNALRKETERPGEMLLLALARVERGESEEVPNFTISLRRVGTSPEVTGATIAAALDRAVRDRKAGVTPFAGDEAEPPLAAVVLLRNSDDRLRSRSIDFLSVITATDGSSMLGEHHSNGSVVLHATDDVYGTEYSNTVHDDDPAHTEEQLHRLVTSLVGPNEDLDDLLDPATPRRGIEN